jgi:hypothetical protein
VDQPRRNAVRYSRTPIAFRRPISAASILHDLLDSNKAKLAGQPVDQATLKTIAAAVTNCVRIRGGGLDIVTDGEFPNPGLHLSVTPEAR